MAENIKSGVRSWSPLRFCGCVTCHAIPVMVEAPDMASVAIAVDTLAPLSPADMDLCFEEHHVFPPLPEPSQACRPTPVVSATPSESGTIKKTPKP